MRFCRHASPNQALREAIEEGKQEPEKSEHAKAGQANQGCGKPRIQAFPSTRGWQWIHVMLIGTRAANEQVSFRAAV
jgi:hypothetical protein